MPSPETSCEGHGCLRQGLTCVCTPVVPQAPAEEEKKSKKRGGLFRWGSKKSFGSSRDLSEKKSSKKDVKGKKGKADKVPTSPKSDPFEYLNVEFKEGPLGLSIANRPSDHALTVTKCSGQVPSPMGGGAFSLFFPFF